jgi:hypothetical protein
MKIREREHAPTLVGEELVAQAPQRARVAVERRHHDERDRRARIGEERVERRARALHVRVDDVHLHLTARTRRLRPRTQPETLDDLELVARKQASRFAFQLGIHCVIIPPCAATLNATSTHTACLSDVPTKLALAACSALMLVASVAAAQPRAKKPPPKKKGPDVAAAVASGDPLRICKTAIELGKSGDLVRAGLLVSACEHASTDDAIANAALADDAKKTRIAISKAAVAGDWSKVELVIKTEGATATIDTYSEIALVAGTYRLPPGTYHIVARTAAGATASELVLKDGNRSLVMLEPPAAAAPTRHKTLDFTSGEPMDAPHAGPPVIKNESLIPERFLKGLRPKK